MQRVSRLGIDISLSKQAAKRRLDMCGRTAEPIIKVEIAKGCIEIVARKEAYHPPSHPETFRPAGRSPQYLLRFRKLIDRLLGILPVSGLRLLRGFLVAGLSKARGRDKKQRRCAKEGYGETLTNAGHGSSGLGPLQPDDYIPNGGWIRQHCGDAITFATRLQVKPTVYERFEPLTFGRMQATRRACRLSIFRRHSAKQCH